LIACKNVLKHVIFQHYSSASATSIHPQTIVCRLKSWKQKENILKNARKIKPHGSLFVNEDLAAETLQKRKAQMPKLIEAKQAGKIAYFILDKLIVRNRPVVEIK
jgi:predicted ABC-type ATPase